jgi:hypothetical protein
VKNDSKYPVLPHADTRLWLLLAVSFLGVASAIGRCSSCRIWAQRADMPLAPLATRDAPSASSSNAISFRRRLTTEGACSVTGTEPIRVAMCFYGSVRNFNNTLTSIQHELIGPLHRSAAVDLFMHALQVETIVNERGESGVPLDVDDYKRLPVCAADADEQEAVDRKFSLSRLAAAEVRASPKGPYAYSKTTIQNIFRSRYSIDRVRALVRHREQTKGFKYTHVVLARPDVRYDRPVAWDPRMGEGEGEHIWVPNHCQWQGVCDRFAAGTADAMLNIVMQQWTHQVRKDGPIFRQGVWMAERAFCEQLKQMPSLRVSVIPICIRRVRSDNTVYDLDNDLRPTVDAPTCLGKQFEAATSDMSSPCPALSRRKTSRSSTAEAQRALAARPTGVHQKLAQGRRSKVNAPGASSANAVKEVGRARDTAFSRAAGPVGTDPDFPKHWEHWLSDNSSSTDRRERRKAQGAWSLSPAV